jgi:hypothetical protein
MAYTAQSTIPQPEIKVIIVDFLNNPTKTNNSPTKLLVPGRPMFAKEKNKKKVENNGIT